MLNVMDRFGEASIGGSERNRSVPLSVSMKKWNMSECIDCSLLFSARQQIESDSFGRLGVGVLRDVEKAGERWNTNPQSGSLVSK